MKFKELQTVKLHGVIVAVYQGGKAYEIEIVNKDGTTATLFTISHEDLEAQKDID